jgi:hypothetical protein
MSLVSKAISRVLGQCWVSRRKFGEFGFLLDIVHRVLLVSFVMGI